MSSDKRNSIIAKAIGLIFLLFNVALSLDMPFEAPLFIKCDPILQNRRCMHIFQNSFDWTSVFYRERWISLPNYSLASWAMPKIQPWIAGGANKQFVCKLLRKNSIGAWTNNPNLLMQRCTKLKLGSFYSPGILHPPRYSWQSIYISLPDNEGIFTEKRSSINSFVTATWTNGHNSKTNPSIKTKQRFLNSQ